MLSQVKFTFKNTDSHDYNMEISDITVSAVKATTGTATYEEEGLQIYWDTQSGETADYGFGTLNDIAEEFSETTHTTTCFVIPQDNEQLEVFFYRNFL